jgi:hypothetical protein
MRHLLSTISVATVVCLSACANPRPPIDPSREDSAVLLAVINHTVRPLVDERDAAQGRGPSKPVVYEQNARICRREGAQPCAQGVFVQTLDDVGGKLGFGWEPAIPPLPTTTKATLAREFSLRNQESRPLPVFALGSDALTLAPQADLAALEKSGQGYAAVSLPGYSDDRYAVLNSSFWCGGLCGYTWTFMLEKIENKWEVKSRRLILIR